MKPLFITLIRCLPLLSLAFSIQTASAFYDPAVQRWVNRDPAGDEAHMARALDEESPERFFALRQASLGNSFAFVDNAPGNGYDLDGRVLPLAGGVIILGTGEVIFQGLILGTAACSLIPDCKRALDQIMRDLYDGVCEMGKRAARNAKRIGHRGGNDAETHEDAQGHGGREKPNMESSKRRPPPEAPAPSEPQRRPKFPNVDKVPK